MRKRAGLARALVLDPEILLIDEPDSGLDPVRTALLCELIKEVHAENGGCYMVISHDLGTARRIADQPPQALRMAKALLRQGRDANFDQMLEMSAAMQALAHLTEDHAEGVDAVLNNRPANFTGR